MPRVLLKKLEITNFGPIKTDEIVFEPFTYFVGRNNAGKSHYLRAVEVLLAPKAPAKLEIAKLQNDVSKEILLVGHFSGVGDFTSLVAASNHKRAIEEAIQGDTLRVVRMLHPEDETKNAFGVYDTHHEVHNPGGFSANLLKVLPEAISIPATADTAEELKNTQNTALSKLKKEVMAAFFEELRVKTRDTISALDTFLHGTDERRSADLTLFEERLKEELMGEFANVIPSVEFGLPDEEVIAKEMKILLDDGYKSEVEQKGHGLQRATLLALLRVLAKHGTRYQDRPRPIFLIGELESFLHPSAQKQFASVLNSLVDQYQVITSTHSPFILSPKAIEGYRRVQKSDTDGAKAIMTAPGAVDSALLVRHLERRGNLEGLFADRIVLVEGTHDEGFYEKLRSIFGILLQHYTIFVKAGGKEELRQSRKFYKQMRFGDVALICDLDYLFSNDFKHLATEIGVDESRLQALRQHIGWTSAGDPALSYIMEKLKENGEPADLRQMLGELRGHRIFALQHGCPENYYRSGSGDKYGWMNLSSEAGLTEPEYLKQLMQEVLG